MPLAHSQLEARKLASRAERELDAGRIAADMANILEVAPGVTLLRALSQACDDAGIGAKTGEIANVLTRALCVVCNLDDEYPIASCGDWAARAPVHSIISALRDVSRLLG